MAKSHFLSATAISGLRKKVLYVDDMNYSLISLKKGLNDRYEVFLAETAAKMYKILENVKPDIILLDVNMPDVGGYDTIKKLKADERYGDIPVIFLTCNSDKESVVKGLSLGAADYIVKPFYADKLIENIENIFNSAALKKEGGSAKKNNAPSVLVVDDMTSMLRTIHHALHEKYNVFLISKSDIVIDFLQNNKPDVIMLDYLMPGLTGFDLVPKIRELPDYKITPIIIVSTEGTFKNVNDAIALGATDFIVKPFDPKELNYKIEKLLKKIEKQRENEEIAFLLN